MQQENFHPGCLGLVGGVSVVSRSCRGDLSVSR